MSDVADGKNDMALGSARRHFDGLGERAWLNCAHQSPLPNQAVAEAHEALDAKRSPWQIGDAASPPYPSDSGTAWRA